MCCAFKVSGRFKRSEGLSAFKKSRQRLYYLRLPNAQRTLLVSVPDLFLYSDMGRILCSITDDTLGWHDPLGGCSDAALVAKKYGSSTYQVARNNWHQNALDGFLIELAKYGLALAI